MSNVSGSVHTSAESQRAAERRLLEIQLKLQNEGRPSPGGSGRHATSQLPLIAVVGATGQQGGGVVRALRGGRQFRVRALTRNPDKHRGLAAEVVAADLDRPDTLRAAFAGAHGVFLVTNFWEEGTDETRQATAAIRAAREAGVKHLVWSTLPNVEEISGGRFHVPHFTGKARIDRVVKEAGFANHTFVIAPMYYQNLLGVLAPQRQAGGSLGWTVPIDPFVRCIHMGDVRELGVVVAGAFAHPEKAGHGEYLPLVGDCVSFGGIVATLNRQGHHFSVSQVPKEVFALSPGGVEIAETFAYFRAHTYLGVESSGRIALADEVAGQPPTPFADWARANFPAQTRADANRG